MSILLKPKYFVIHRYPEAGNVPHPSGEGRGYTGALVTEICEGLFWVVISDGGLFVLLVSGRIVHADKKGTFYVMVWAV